ncbi:MAG: putative toxin-antitoxin system toxin component, PIN family [Gemmatimonadota bacterium]
MRAVLDANVVVSAFLRPAGPPGEILRHWLEEGSFQVVLSPEILEEIRDALFRPHVRQRIDRPDEEIERLLIQMELLAESLTDPPEVHVVKSDPDDDKYLATALASHADYIVSGDPHLLSIGEWEAIRIVSPREFIQILAPRS